MDGIGTKPRLRAEGKDSASAVDQTFSPDDVPDLPAALDRVEAWLRQTQTVSLAAVGHRVVHGGPEYSQPTMIDAEVLARLERYVPLAPLHQPHNLAPIRLLLARRPDLPQVACFDTAFHRGHGALADHYAIPERFYAEGVRRYGFHGLSYEYIAERLRQVAPDVAAGARDRGASGKRRFPVRPVRRPQRRKHDGIHGAGRPADGDPVRPDRSRRASLPPHREGNDGGETVQDLLYRDSGLKGLSGVSNDVRDLLGSTEPSAAFAIDYFVYRVALHAGMLAAALGGLDAFVFTAGIGENSGELRRRIAEKLGWLGAKLDPAANAERKQLISTAESRVGLYVIPTDEELMIAKHTLALVSGAPSKLSERKAR